MKNSKWKLLVVMVAVIVLACGVYVINNNSYNYAVIYDVEGEELARLESGWSDSFGQNQLLQEDIIIDSVIYQVVKDMEQEGFEHEEIIKGLNYDGWKIYSTIDSEKQDKLVSYYSERKNFVNQGKEWEDIPQSSMIVMDYDGKIQALIGGTNGDTQYNRATRTLYQVGSTIKPVSVYGLLINEKLIHYSSLAEDVPTSVYIDGELTPWPTNADRKYEGQITVADALAVSKNTVPVNYGERYGPQNIYNYLQENFYSTLVNENMRSDIDVSALALGYLNDGISLDELVGSYIPFGNGGVYGGTTCYTHIVDCDDNEVFVHRSDKKQIMDSGSAYIMNRLLVNNVESPRGIAKGASIPEVEVAGKTGTVAKDECNLRKLFVGMTPEYVIGLQYSFDEMRSLSKDEVTNTEIWKNYVSTLDLDQTEFDKDPNIIAKEYCARSGKLRSEYCEEEDIQIGYYTNETVPGICTKCENLKE